MRRNFHRVRTNDSSSSTYQPPPNELDSSSVNYQSHLLVKSPSSISTRSFGSNTPQWSGLHELCGEAYGEEDDANWKQVLHHLSKHPHEASQIQDALYQWTPLHICCLGCPPSYVVQALLHAAPSTVELADRGGRLPLHLACASGASDSVLKTLIQAYPEALNTTDNKGMTPLHMLFRSSSEKIVSGQTVSLLASRRAAVRASEVTMQLPIHCACRRGVSLDVLKVLVAANPDGLMFPDHKGRTPLMLVLLSSIMTGHFPSFAVIELLLGNVRTSTAGQLSASSAGGVPGQMLMLFNHPAARRAAALASTETGELPLHIAASIGLPFNVLQLIRDAHPAAVETTDIRGRTPLHHALMNPRYPPTPAIVGLLLNSQVAEVRDIEGSLPFHLLCDSMKNSNQQPKNKGYFNKIKGDNNKPRSYHNGDTQEIERKRYCHRYRDFFVTDAATDKEGRERISEFLGQLENFPPWIREQAASTFLVQEIIGEEISKPMPTFMMMLKIYAYIVILVALRFGVYESLESRMENNDGVVDRVSNIESTWIVPALLVCIFVLALQKITQLISVCSLSMFVDSWLFDFWNWLDIIGIALLLIVTLSIETGRGPAEWDFRVFAAVATGVLWLNVISFLRSVNLEIAIIVDGIARMVKRFITFIFLLGIMTVMFAQMFHTLYQGTNECWTIAASDFNNQCSLKDSYIHVYLAYYGGIDLRSASALEVTLVLLFVCVALMLLINFLVTIVKDANIIADRRGSSLLFWTHQLRYTLQCHSMWCCSKFCVSPLLIGCVEDLWEMLWDSFDSNINFGEKWWYKSYVRCLPRPIVMIIAIILIPELLLLGLITGGLLWPPSVRRVFFGAAPFQEIYHDSDRIKTLRNEVIRLETAVSEQAASTRKEVNDLKDFLESRLTNHNYNGRR